MNLALMDKATLFQFQYGSIKSQQIIYSLRFQSCFNSSMVRLKGARTSGGPETIEFQFQYGSIKRQKLKVFQRSKLMGLNTNMVRLKADRVTLNDTGEF